MDFETSDWNVSSDADGLTASLFGKLHDHKWKKKKKSKIQDSHDIHSKHYMHKKEQKITVDDQSKMGTSMSKLERKKLKMQRRKLNKLKYRHQGVSASEGDNHDCMMHRDDRDENNMKCIFTFTKDNSLPSVKRKSNEMDFANTDKDISLLPRKKARTCMNSGSLPMEIERSKSDKNFKDINENENLKRKKQSEDHTEHTVDIQDHIDITEHTVDIQDDSERKKKRRKSKKNEFKVESHVKRDEQFDCITSEKELNANIKSLSGIIPKNLERDVEDKSKKKKRRRKRKKNEVIADSDIKKDQQITSKTSVIEFNSNMKESNIKCLSGSVPKQNEATQRINKNEAGQRLPKSSDTNTIFLNKPSKSHQNSPFNLEKLNTVLDSRHAVKNTTKGQFSDKESSIKEQKRSKNDSPSSSASLKEKMLERLSAARFRYLNEQLYTRTGEKAFQMFQEDANSFAVYHAGFQSQVEKWPNNPVDLMIKFIISRPKHLIIADFGCGDAKIARSVPNKVYSFDLIALNEHVTVCDMARVPLTDSSVDIAVFCLSLMGTNLADYLKEARRVLRNGGILKIAEVQSRFQSLGAFVKKVQMLGFKLTNQDAENKMFIMIDFKKSKPAKSKEANIKLTLDPCVYKKR